jgi:AcrR family transcriptional regulator
MATRKPRPAPGRERILRIATKVFAERGYDGTTMRLIAKRARCNVALAYHHFGSKTALYEEIVGQYATSFASVLRALDTPEGGNRAEVFLDRFIDLMRDNSASVRLIVREAVSPTPVYGERIRHHLRDLLGAGQSVLDHAAAAGMIRRVDAREFLLLVYGMLAYSTAAEPSHRLLFEGDDFDAVRERLRSEAKEIILSRLFRERP